MQSNAATVADYLASLADDRRHMVEAVRKVILDNLESDYWESMQYRMMGFGVALSLFPVG
jgi:hypothetical protein